MKPKIGLITLGVRDVRRAVAFYQEGLGFPLHDYKKGYDMPRAVMAQDAQVPAEGSGFSGVALALT